MTDERWLPLDYILADGNHIRSLYVRGENWQLYTTAEDGLAIAVKESLYNWWIAQGWIEEGLLEEAKTKEEPVFVLGSRVGNMLSSLDYGPYPRDRQQALDFIRAIRRTMDRIGENRINHGIYVAPFSLILPVDPEEEQVNIGRLTGSFLTGGVNVPLGNAPLVLQYAPYLTESDLNRMLDILQLARDEGSIGVLQEGIAEKAIGKRPRARTERTKEPFSLPGRPELERFFREEIIDIVDHEEAYKKMGVGFPGGTVLYGPPGCGKTYAVDKLTEYLGWPVYTIDSGNIGSKYVHETARKVAEIFDEAAQNAPAIVVIDEMEAFLSGRESGMGSREIHMEEVAEFLRKIPEAPGKKVLVFGMTNMLDSIDKAILRRGRFDYMIEAGMPSEEEIVLLLESLLKDKPTAPDLPISKISKKLSGYPISDVAFLVRDAARRTVRKGKEEIDTEILMESIEALPLPESKKRVMGFDLN